MSKTLLSFLLLLAGLLQNVPPGLPTDGTKSVIDNERVSVWDVTWPIGKAAPMAQSPFDVVIVDLADASANITSAKGKTKATTFKVGQATFIPRGDSQMEQGTGNSPRHGIVIELKDFNQAPLDKQSAFPEAFPRNGSKKILNNSRVTLWDYTWTVGVPTPVHFHSKDVVVVYLETGEVQSKDISGAITVNKLERGVTRYNARNRTHSEELVKGASRAIIVELNDVKPRRKYPIETVIQH
ncbi:MAG TPA: hypothetical protein VFO86_10075 [Terriglobia bacterium]|nr:hypothetical protein [Terriglobia bacterium]